MEPLILFGLTAIGFLLIFALMAIKVILKPGSEFKKNCGNLDESGCSHCGRPAGEVCDSHDSGGCEESESDGETSESGGKES